jgi:RimK family alpha-L-glutamate ligase
LISSGMSDRPHFRRIQVITTPRGWPGSAYPAKPARPAVVLPGHDTGVTQIVVLHYPDQRAQNWALLRAAARRRDVRLVSWAPHLLGLWCADGQRSACYAGKPVSPGIMLHRTVAPFRGIVAPALACLAAQGSVVLNPPDAAYRSRDKLLTTMDLVGAGIPVVPTAAFDEPGGADLAALGPGELIVKPARGVRGEGIATHRNAAALIAVWRRRAEWRPGVAPPGYHAEREHYLAQPLIGGGGQDIRAYVVGGTCRALMRRVARPGEVRANLALGATGSPLPLSHPAAAVAAAALTACGLDFGGVDLIEDAAGAVRVLELDAWAGFAGITEVTGADIAGAILEHATGRLARGDAG